ncbi:hypothetical protein GUJ93_ZPchr0009g2122 [Zizania palustris]|uniref:CCT domain-containing protein n=1 Tax=Zizania palustris TaxID=103762 RepID=A0A8J5RBM0_ZIZPA|nr:hypothetical protein GUJ93_ZPchr0009g2122 [Zizania palustris]
MTPFLLVADRSSSPFQQRAVAVNRGDLLAVRRYSAEERQEHINKYRSKRRHRNFNKRITYVGRKRHADGQARVNGCFASGTKDNGGEEVSVDDTPSLLNNNNDITATEAMTTTVPEWWPEMQVEVANREEDLLCAGIVNDLQQWDANKIDMFATSYLGVSSMDLNAYL